MSNMISFSVSILNAVSSFLGSEPIIYLFGLCLFCFVIKAFKILIGR